MSLAQSSAPTPDARFWDRFLKIIHDQGLKNPLTTGMWSGPSNTSRPSPTSP
jgi:hypothetical protein